MNLAKQLDKLGTETAFAETRSSNRVPRVVAVSLERFAGQCVELRFCATALDPGVARGLAGWAEPRIQKQR